MRPFEIKLPRSAEYRKPAALSSPAGTGLDGDTFVRGLVASIIGRNYPREQSMRKRSTRIVQLALAGLLAAGMATPSQAGTGMVNVVFTKAVSAAVEVY